MRTKHLCVVLVLLVLAVPAPRVQAGGVVTVCDEAHLLAALAGGGTVTFACSGVITLTSTITISTDTTIDGSGQNVTISGNSALQVFKVPEDVALSLSSLTIANGSFAGNGGGIYIYYGALRVDNTTFSNNRASYMGGAIANAYGSVEVTNSTFFGNTAYFGGAISNAWISYIGARLAVSNSTFAGNSALADGGAIDNRGGAAMIVSNSTFATNGATHGGAIHNQSYASLRNTLVADGTGGNCWGEIIDDGGNLTYPDTTCPGINLNPRLYPLQDNGGPTMTMALGPGSGALDAGNDAVCAAPPVNNLDQRGHVRPKGSRCDIGAVEQDPYPTTWFPLALRS